MEKAAKWEKIEIGLLFGSHHEKEKDIILQRESKDREGAPTHYQGG